MASRLDRQKNPGRYHKRLNKRKYRRGYAVLPHAVWGDRFGPVGPATGALAAAPGTWLPAGATPPATPASMVGIKAYPNTAWTTGQYMQTALAGPTGRTYWNGTAWVQGVAAAADAPTSSWVKADILTWLDEHGVDINTAAVQALTKDELLQIVQLVLNGDTDPVGSFEASRVTP